MNQQSYDHTHTLSGFLRANMPKSSVHESSGMAASTRDRSGVSRIACRDGQTSRTKDEGIARLRKLRDYYRQTDQPSAMRAIERAIIVLREVM